MPAIVYLTAKGIGGYRSRLRSDTLWGALCWSIRELYGDAGLQGMLAAYPSGAGAFQLSSAFPWVKTERYGITHFLPHPLVQPPLSKEIPTEVGGIPEKAKAYFRKRKKVEAARKGYITWQQFAYHFGDGTPDLPAITAKIDSRAVTRNQIDRSRLGVLTEGDSGQLFHMNENFVRYTLPEGDRAQAHGLYFLLDGDSSMVLPALRLMESTGIGGDRTVGKGHFGIRWEADAYQLGDGGYALPRVANPNARVNLSIYNPDAKWKVLQDYEKAAASNAQQWQYKLDVRQGRTVLQGDYLQKSRLLFAEGSVFPRTDASPYPGINWDAGKHSLLTHKIHRYGHAFLLDIRLK